MDIASLFNCSSSGPAVDTDESFVDSKDEYEGEIS